MVWSRQCQGVWSITDTLTEVGGGVAVKVGGLNDATAVDVQGGQQDGGAVAEVLVFLAGRAAGGNRLGWPGAAAVSYTHLTLPTIYSV